ATEVVLHVDNHGPRSWRAEVFDAPDACFAFAGLPRALRLAGQGRATVRYSVTALRRGPVTFGATQLRWRSLGGCFELLHALGEPQALRVYPNFAAVAGYAWLAGDRRLSQIGIKTYAQRGA